MKTIYLAGPIFSHAEQAWMSKLKQRIEDCAASDQGFLEVIWPFESTLKESDGASAHERMQSILDVCASGLEKANTLVAVLDGAQVDDGTSWEIGYFYQKNRSGKNIIGLRTDFRAGGDTTGAQVNSLIDASCSIIVRSVPDLLEIIRCNLSERG